MSGGDGGKPRLWAVGEVRRKRRLPLVILAALLVCGAGAGLALWLAGRQPEASTTSGAAPTSSRASTRMARRPVRQLGATELAVRRFAAVGLPLYCGGTSKRYVALTFDDGPGSQTWRAVRMLHAARVHATFFLVGRQVAARRQIVRSEAEIAALGDHSWSHPSLIRLKRRGILRQIRWTRSAIQRASGQDALLFRPPYGAHDRRVDRAVRREGMLEVLWSVDSGDSFGLGWRKIARGVLRNVRPGSIVVFHENNLKTLRALQRVLLPALRRRHYRLVSIPELLVLDPPSQRQLRRRDC
ncbi:MAG: polysaccharide deacetylase family protein [Gaiellaceae bacterium]